MTSDQRSSIRTQLENIQNEGLMLSVESATQLTALRDDLLGAVKALIGRQGMEENRVLNPINGDQTRNASSAEAVNVPFGHLDEQIKSLKEVRDSLTALYSMTTSMPRENRILRQLFFPSMYNREDNMQPAGDGTFKWILEEEEANSSSDKSDAKSGEMYDSSSGEEGVSGSLPQTVSSHDEKENDSTDANRGVLNSWEKIFEEEQTRRSLTRRSFLSWLRTGNRVFHIPGKAGSGKSTLMKYLCHHPRTRQELECWAGEKKLVFAYFFFWNSGDEL